jgi:hypothetical protein
VKVNPEVLQDTFTEAPASLTQPLAAPAVPERAQLWRGDQVCQSHFRLGLLPMPGMVGPLTYSCCHSEEQEESPGHGGEVFTGFCR